MRNQTLLLSVCHACRSDPRTALLHSDGTGAGTTLVKDVNPGRSGSSINYMMECNGKLFFRASSCAERDPRFKITPLEFGELC